MAVLASPCMLSACAASTCTQQQQQQRTAGSAAASACCAAMIPPSSNGCQHHRRVNAAGGGCCGAESNAASEHWLQCVPSALHQQSTSTTLNYAARLCTHNTTPPRLTTATRAAAVPYNSHIAASHTPGLSAASSKAWCVHSFEA